MYTERIENRHPARSAGMTLVELVLAIALAGLMVAGIMSSYSAIAGRSADPMIRIQTVAVAESLLEEALLKPFLDPATLTRCPPSPGGARDNFNNICDYAGYSASAVTLPNGAAVTGLENYAIAISVEDIASGELGSVPTQCALKVTVTVTSPLHEATILTGYRTDYESTPPCS